MINQSTASELPLIPRTHLFDDPINIGASISCDGRFVAWLAPYQGVLNVWVAPLDSLHRSRLISTETGSGVRFVTWTYCPNLLVYITDNLGGEDFHVHAVDVENGIVRDLTPFKGVQAMIERTSRKHRNEILISMNRRDPKFPDLYRVNLNNGELSLVVKNDGFRKVLTDDDFKPKIAARTVQDGSYVILLSEGNEGWKNWILFPREDARTSRISHLDAAGQVLYLWDSRQRNTAALVQIDLTTGKTTLLAEDAHTDIGDLITDPYTYKPLAYSVVSQHREWIAIEDCIQRDLEFLGAQRIGEWSVNNRSENGRYWVIGTESDMQPPAECIYDSLALTLTMLNESYPKITRALLAPMHPVTIVSRDGLQLLSYLTLPRGSTFNEAKNQERLFPLVLVVHGGPWNRDVFGFNAIHQWLANRGYAALSVNFRGSTGFGKNFTNAGDGEWGRRMDDDLLDAVSWAIENRIADAKRIAIFGGSYGGYAALVALARNPKLYSCGIDIVGPSNLETFLRAIPPYWESIRIDFCLAIGDPDTVDGQQLLRERSPLFHAARIEKPLLIVHGANDPRVKQDESDRMASELEANGIPVTYLLYPDEGHGLQRPENRLSFFAAAEYFLAKYLGGKLEPIHTDDFSSSSMKVIKGDIIN